MSRVGWIGHDEDGGTGRVVVDELGTFAMGKIVIEGNGRGEEAKWSSCYESSSSTRLRHQTPQHQRSTNFDRLISLQV